MAMPANLSKLASHGSQALRCRNPHCRKPFIDGVLIEGPSRDRQNVGKAREYWHTNCTNPQFAIYHPNNTNTNANGDYFKETFTPILDASTEWQRDTNYNAPAPSLATDMSAASLVSSVVAAINQTLVPQLEAATNQLETELKALINENHADLHTRIVRLSERVTDLTDHLDTVRHSVEMSAERIAALEAAKPVIVTIVTNDGAIVNTANLGSFHHKLPEVIRLLTTLHPERRNVWLAGPAGSGKTTAARQIANALNLPFYFNGAIDTEYKLSGFIDANGNVINTAFRESWTNGGVYLFDECDASLAGALTAFNGALANGHAPFPGAVLPVARHANCYILAAANTWGFGGDSHYVGRAKLDGAFLSRFIRVPWDYDEALERAISGSDTRSQDWVNVVRECRDTAATKGAFFLITPRDSLNGADLMRGGFTNAEVVENIFGYIKRQDANEYRNCFAAAERFASRTY